MPPKKHTAGLSLLFAIRSVCLGQATAPENINTSSIATPAQNARGWEATERRYLEALAVANKAQGDQRLSRFWLSLALAEYYKFRHRYGDAENYFRSARDVALNLFGE